MISALTGQMSAMGEAMRSVGPWDVVWTSVVGCSASGNNLTKTVAQGWGNSGAVSTQTLASGDGYVEVTASETTKARIFGLGNGNTNESYTDIEYGLLLQSGASVQVYEAGTLRGTYGTYATGDTMRVAVEGGVVKYKKNGTTFYTSAVVPTYPLLVDAALYSVSVTLTAAVVGGGAWT